MRSMVEGARAVSAPSARLPPSRRFLPCEAGEGDHAKHGGGGLCALCPLSVLAAAAPGVNHPRDLLGGDRR